MFGHTDTLVLRPLTPDDFAAFTAYRSDPEIARFQSWPMMSDEDTRGFLWAMKRVEKPFHADQWTQIAVAQPDGTLMGDMGLHLSKDGAEAELGVTLARAFHRQGIATQAMRLAITLAFAEPTVTRIIAGADQRNTGSLGLLHKLGFVWTHSEDMGDGAVDDMFEMRRPA